MGKLTYVIAGTAVLFSPVVAVAEGTSRDIEVVEPPRPDYPAKAGAYGLTGICEVRFSVDVHGNSTSIQAACSHPLFCAPAKSSVARAKFRPKLEEGVPVRRNNIIYPLEFGSYWIDSETGETIATTPPDGLVIIPCDERAVS